MKALKIGLVVLASLVLLLVVAVALLFVPAVQKSLVTRLASGPEGTLKADYLRVGWSETRARSLVYSQKDASYTIGELRADLSLRKLLFRREVHIGELEVTGVVIDIVEVIGVRREEREPKPDEAFEGILNEIELPVPIYLTRARVEGEVLTPGAGDEAVRSRFVLTGGGLAPGQEARFEIAGEVRDPAPAAAIAVLDLEGELTLQQSAEGAFEHIDLALQLHSTGGQLELQDRLRFDVVLAAVEDGETYFAEISRLQAPGAGGDPLLTINSRYRSRAREIGGTWRLWINEDHLLPFTANMELPAFWIQSSGEFSRGTVAAQTALAGQIELRAEHLGAVAEALRGLGGFSLDAQFEGEFGEEELRLDQLLAELRDQEGRTLLDLRNFEPVVYDREAEALIGAEEGASLLAVSLRGLPVEWASLFLQTEDEQEEINVRGGSLNGQLLVTAEDGAIAFRMAEPLRSDSISVHSGPDLLLRDISLEASLSGVVRDGVVEALMDAFTISAGGQEMLLASARFHSGSEEATGRLEIDLPVLLAQPAFGETAGSSGRFSAEFSAALAEGMQLTATGTLQDAAYADFPDMVLRASFDLAMDETALRLQELVADVRNQEGQTFLDAKTFQPIHYDFEAQQVIGIENRMDLLTLSLQELPLEWLNQFLETDDPEAGVAFAGGVVSGQLLASADRETFSVRLVEPLRATNAGLRSGEEWLLREISMEASGSGAMRNSGGLEIEMDRLTVSSGRRSILQLTGNYNSGSGTVAARLQASLPALMAQPLMADYRNASAGIVSLDLEASLDGAGRIEASGAIRDLVLLREKENVPAVTVQVLISEVAEDQWEIEIPLRVEGQQPSELRLAGRVAAGDPVSRFQLHLGSDFLQVEELLLVASAFSSEAEDAPAPPERAPEERVRDEEPLWSGFDGSLALALKDVVLPGGHPLQGLEGLMTVQENEVTTELAGTMLDGPLSIEGQLEFVAERERPYLLDGGLEAPGLSSGEFFRKLQPNRPPTVEAVFAASARFSSDGLDAEDLIERFQFELNMNATEGVFRLFYTENPLANIGLAAGGLLGSVSKEVRTVTDVASMLSNLPITELNLVVERDADLNFLLRDLTFVSPELRLRGVGEVRHREGVEVLLQPMRIQLQPAVRGDLEQHLASIGILSDQRDQQGYRLMLREIAFTGTPANPDNRDFYRWLVEAAIGLFAPQRNGGEGEETAPPSIPGILEGIFRERRR